jgi:hypothetical protein
MSIAGTRCADGRALHAIPLKDPDAPLGPSLARDLVAEELAAR